MILIDCPERIACDVCAVVCDREVILIRQAVTNRPEVVNEGNCRNCGLCVAHCPGQAIFLMSDTGPDGQCRITLPYELDEAAAWRQDLLAVDKGEGGGGRGDVSAGFAGKYSKEIGPTSCQGSERALD